MLSLCTPRTHLSLACRDQSAIVAAMQGSLRAHTMVCPGQAMQWCSEQVLPIHQTIGLDGKRSNALPWAHMMVCAECQERAQLSTRDCNSPSAHVCVKLLHAFGRDRQCATRNKAPSADGETDLMQQTHAVTPAWLVCTCVGHLAAALRLIHPSNVGRISLGHAPKLLQVPASEWT